MAIKDTDGRDKKPGAPVGGSARNARKQRESGRGPWWNAGASHMNEAFPKKYFDTLGLVSLLDQVKRIQLTM